MAKRLTKIEKFKDKKGEFRFRVRARNGAVTVMTSEGYTTGRRRDRAIEVMIEACAAKNIVAAAPDPMKIRRPKKKAMRARSSRIASAF